MNELSNQIKNLSYCLTVVPVSNRIIEAFACRHDLKAPLEKLNKAVKRQRSTGYDLEGKKLPIENTLLTVLDRIHSNKLNINEVQKHCSLLTQLEKTALLELTSQILEKMNGRADKAQEILNAMAEKGLRLEDLKGS